MATQDLPEKYKEIKNRQMELSQMAVFYLSLNLENLTLLNALNGKLPTSNF